MPDITARPETDATEFPAFIRRPTRADSRDGCANGTKADAPPPDDPAEVLQGMIEDAQYALDCAREDERNARTRAEALARARRNLTPGGPICIGLGLLIDRERQHEVDAAVAAQGRSQDLRDLNAALALALAATGRVAL